VVPAGGGQLLANGRMWVAPQAEADPKALYFQAEGRELDPAALAAGYLPQVTRRGGGWGGGGGGGGGCCQGSRCGGSLACGWARWGACRSGAGPQARAPSCRPLAWGLLPTCSCLITTATTAGRQAAAVAGRRAAPPAGAHGGQPSGAQDQRKVGQHCAALPAEVPAGSARCSMAAGPVACSSSCSRPAAGCRLPQRRHAPAPRPAQQRPGLLRAELPTRPSPSPPTPQPNPARPGGTCRRCSWPAPCR
jgi:hypothetical protein